MGGEREKFALKQEGFGADYAEKAHLQKRFNTKIILGLVDSIIQWFPNTDDRPLSILDLCCGDGGSTYELLKTLTASGVKVKQLVGYDISREQIKKASEYSEKDARLTFVEQDVEKMVVDQKYDVVISLFGLHWMENLDAAAKKIHESLEQNGKIVFFVPLEKMDLFKIRNNFLSSPKWKSHFEGYSIHPFISDTGDYIQVFDKYFFTSQYQRGSEEKEYSEEAFIKFLSSWMQEARHISEERTRMQYVRELVESIPENVHPNVSRTVRGDDRSIRFTEHFFYFSAHKEKQLSLAKNLEQQRDQQEEKQPLLKKSEATLWGYKLAKYATLGVVAAGIVSYAVAQNYRRCT